MTAHGHESAIEILTRWEAHGATWRIVTLTDALAVIELCTCLGTPVDMLRSRDPEFLRFVAAENAPGRIDD
jgi:hypothetical protein